MSKLLSRLCLVPSDRGTQGADRTTNFQLVPRCALVPEPTGTPDSHSSNHHIACYYLMSWALLSEWHSRTAIGGRCSIGSCCHGPLRKEGRKKSAVRQLNCLCRPDLVCGKRFTAVSSNAVSGPSFASREHLKVLAHASQQPLKVPP